VEERLAQINEERAASRKKASPKVEIKDVKDIPVTDFMKFNEKNKALCPFHNEKSGSFTYYPKKNNCYCFGCGKYADVIDIVGVQNNLTFKEALQFLRDKYLI
jgi:DNA primase